MKKIRGLLKVVALIIPIVLLMNSFVLAAKDTSATWLTTYNSGVERKTGHYTVSVINAGISPTVDAIKIVHVTNQAGGALAEDYNTQIYCIKVGTGFGSAATAVPQNYNVHFDLRNPESIETVYKAVLPTGTAYNQLMWILDNICKPDDTASRNALLTAAGLDTDAFDDYTLSGVNQADLRYDIIEVIQQAAMWYYTNPTNYHPYGGSDGKSPVFSVTYNGNTYALDDLSDDFVDDPVIKLYQYLINGASATYDYTTPGASPLTYTKGFSSSSTQATTEIIGTNYIIGPFRIDNNNSKALTNNSTATLTSGAKLVGSDKTTELTGSSLIDKIKNSFGTDFYISVPVATAPSSISITVNPKYNAKTLTYRMTEDPTNQQPVVIIDETEVGDPASATFPLNPPEFDLALRKFITSVTKTDGSSRTISTRVPVVVEGKLASETTADYKHRKDTVEVETGDKVNYTLRIYNEGSAAGRATKIVDQLPTGLTYSSIISGNFDLGEYNTETNRLTLNRKSGNTSNLSAYTAGSLSIEGTGYEDIVIQCTVEATPNTTGNKVLTNVAWISEEINAVTGETIITETGKDRDSEPGTTPNVNKDNMSEYKGTTSDPILGNPDTYYPGQQDDDDFERLVIKPVEKRFDLALRKWIGSIEKADGSVSNQLIRHLVVDETPLVSGTGKTAIYKHSKNPITVENGDHVYYNLRIYNEGEVVGRATKIVDQLPTGVVFEEVTAGNFELDSYDEADNRLSLKRKTDSTTNLPAFTEGSLQANGNGHETITIKCKVNVTTETDEPLTNVAWISEEINGETGEVITTEEEKDRDSEPGTAPDVNKDNMSDYKGTTTEEYLSQEIYYPGQQDDDDFEKIVLKQNIFDLALRKYITKVVDSKGTEKTIPSREPQITAEEKQKLANKQGKYDEGTTSEKTHSKTPVSVEAGDIVTYTIRVYNEGNVDGYVREITDYLPTGLEFIADNEINSIWTYDNATRKVTTDSLKEQKINAFNGTDLDSKYVQIVCRVIATSNNGKNLRNIAAITEDSGDDIDSRPEDVNPETYNPEAPENGKGEQDDDDFEDLLLKRFDLALRKFITGVNDEEIKNREPKVDASKFGTTDSDGKIITTCTYTHTKEPVKVEHNDTVIYTIRVYNEGTVNGYADIIKDDIPDGLEFLPDNDINKTYGWKLLDKDGNETTDVKSAKYITTDFRSKAKDQPIEEYMPGNPYSKGSTNLLLAFDPTTMKNGPDYVDVKVAFKVTEPNTSDRIITNQAQVTKHTDEDGEDTTDIDSTPDEWIDGEDDQDIEHIYVKYFDLSLKKWVTHAIIIEDGEQKEMPTGHKAEDDPESVVKIEINKERLESTVIKFRYSIRIKNEGEIAGYATEISDYIPNGLRFNQADNPKWKEENGKIVTDQLKDTLLQPGDTATIEVILTWENSERNMGVMINVAEISEDHNDSDTPDIDSTPDNKKEGEDDIDDAPVALTVVAGRAPTYIAIASGVVAIVGAGIFFIKKYVI